MMLQLQPRALSRYVLAGLIAAASSVSIAQVTAPGGVAEAQAQSRAGGAHGNPATSGPSGAAGGAPRGASSTPPRMPPPSTAVATAAGVPPAAGTKSAAAGAAGAAGAAAAATQQEVKLKPLIIQPPSPDVDMPGPAAPTQALVQSATQTSNPFALRTTPPADGTTGAAPSGAPGASPFGGDALNQGTPSAPKATTGAAKSPEKMGKGGKPLPKLDKHGKPVPTEPYINLECSTPEIKLQGNFIGKMNGKYVYKYKNQYCFDLEP